MLTSSMALFIKVWHRFLRLWWGVAVPVELRLLGATVGPNCIFFARPIVSIHPRSVLTIGSGVVLCSDSRFTALGVDHPVVIRTMAEGAVISIGENVGMSGTTVCAAQSVIIGSDCLIGAGVTIVDTDFHPISAENRRTNKNPSDISTARVIIGNNVFIGARTIILKGVTIGDNSVIGAGSVVRTSVPSDSIAVGNPAVTVKSLSVRGSVRS